MDRGGQERRDVLQALIVLATHDSEFLNRLRESPASTLRAYGFDLRDAETDRVFRYLIEHKDEGDEEIIGALGSVERRWM